MLQLVIHALPTGVSVPTATLVAVAVALVVLGALVAAKVIVHTVATVAARRRPVVTSRTHITVIRNAQEG